MLVYYIFKMLLKKRKSWKKLIIKKLCFFKSIIKEEYIFYDKFLKIYLQFPLRYISIFSKNIFLIENSLRYENTNIFFLKTSISFRKTFYILKRLWEQNSCGYSYKLKIKGFGRKSWQTRNFIWFRLGQSKVIRWKLSNNIFLSIHKKKTIIKAFSFNKFIGLNFLKKIIKLRPTFDYKDVGVRFLNQKPLLRKRRISSY
jgi:hypothetical protein